MPQRSFLTSNSKTCKFKGIVDVPLGDLPYTPQFPYATQQAAFNCNSLRPQIGRWNAYDYQNGGGILGFGVTIYTPWDEYNYTFNFPNMPSPSGASAALDSPPFFLANKIVGMTLARGAGNQIFTRNIGPVTAPYFFDENYVFAQGKTRPTPGNRNSVAYFALNMPCSISGVDDMGEQTLMAIYTAGTDFGLAVCGMGFRGTDISAANDAQFAGISGTGSRVLMNIPRWQFNHMLMYRFSASTSGHPVGLIHYEWIAEVNPFTFSVDIPHWRPAYLVFDDANMQAWNEAGSLSKDRCTANAEGFIITPTVAQLQPHGVRNGGIYISHDCSEYYILRPDPRSPAAKAMVDSATTGQWAMDESGVFYFAQRRSTTIDIKSSYLHMLNFNPRPVQVPQPFALPCIPCITPYSAYGEN